MFSKLGGKFGIPSLLLFILVGILAGSDGLGGIYFDDFKIAQSVGIVSLAFILFMGGLSVKPSQIKPVFAKGLSLSTAGVFITAVVTGLLSHYFLNFSVLECMLLGGIISSTDAAAVFSVLRSKNISLKNNLKPLLEFESGSNDPMAVFLTVGTIALITGELNSVFSLFGMFFQQMLLGVICGYLIAKFAVFVINKIQLEYDGLYIVITLSTVLLGYSLTSLIGGNGFMCIYVCGLTMATCNFIHKNTLIKFHDGIAWIMQIVMFLVLGLLVFVKEVAAVTVSGLIVALVLIFIARPLAVFIGMAPFKDVNFKEKLLISWVGLRGAAPIVLATFPLSSGVAHSHEIFNIVFFVVIVSVIIQGTTIPAAAKLLGADAPADKKYNSLLEYDTADTNNKMVEIIVPNNSNIIGQKLLELGLPSKCLIAMIYRGEDYLIPSGQTKIEASDVLFILMDKNSEEIIKEKIKEKKMPN